MQRNLNFEFLNSLTAEVATQPLFFAKISEVNIRYSFTSYRNKYKIERNKECSRN